MMNRFFMVIRGKLKFVHKLAKLRTNLVKKIISQANEQISQIILSF